MVNVAKFRQLTEAKRSPVSAIENDQQRTIAQHGRKRARRTPGIGQSKIPGQRTHPQLFSLGQAPPENSTQRSPAHSVGPLLTS